MDEIRDEIYKRERSPNVFPLDVFNDQVKPFINSLNKHYDIPASFIGLSLLSSYSTGVGTSYAVTTNGKDLIYLPIWAALVGISSAGKTIALNKLFGPLENIQNEYDQHWDDKTKGLSDVQVNFCKLDTVIYRDAHIPTLVKSVLPDNPKGLIKYSDELLEWINGMNQLTKKEGTDEQFWISSWNCTKYSGIRSGKQKFVIRRPFVNVIGGAQYSVLAKLFAKDRDTTGFIFRLLFALPDVDKIAEPDPSYEVPAEWAEKHRVTIERLYKNLPVDSFDDEPRRCLLTPDAVKLYQVWTKAKVKEINAMEDLDEKDIHSGILGKIKEYALRFSALLHLADKAMDPGFDGSAFNSSFKQTEYVTSDTVQRALKLADYFFQSASHIYERVSTTMTAPAEVLIAATMLKLGRSFREIGEAYYNENSDKAKKAMERKIKHWIREYPKVFNAVAK